MFFTWLKHYLPRSLYGRAALIMMLPVVVLQLVVMVVFTQRHFEDVTLQMSDTVVRELKLALSDVPLETREVLQISIVDVEHDALNGPNVRPWYDFSGIVITRRLMERLPQIKVVDLSADKVVRLVAEVNDQAKEVMFDRRRISAANPHQLFVNMAFFGLIFTLIAMIYLRNQLRPIKRLAIAAEGFGRGRHIAFSPAGATEVRAAGTAFVDMRNRIERQIETRTLMLSGVSHDLRTPLTRMRLALAMLDDAEREPLEQDVDEMQGMIDAFLDFTKGGQGAEPEAVDMTVWIKQVVADAGRAGRDVKLVHCEGEGTVMLRLVAMRRALDNLIGNAVRYGSSAEVSMVLTDKSLRLRVEDDGPGIPENRRVEAQRPFTRLDPSRNQDKGSSVGLGLAIATDIARAHGGVLRLGESERLGGLRADIVIAR
ncbi:MAG: two-component system osmolarity sensor histidine kinase EnvZ [Candidatus Azotimanducaceae bacterium]|jgi:two-component system osmolarity sensor histidine kinase EnvZ